MNAGLLEEAPQLGQLGSDDRPALRGLQLDAARVEARRLFRELLDLAAQLRRARHGYAPLEERRELPVDDGPDAAKLFVDGARLLHHRGEDEQRAFPIELERAS